MKFKRFAQYLHHLEETPSRLEITRILADLLQQADPEEIAKVVNLSLGQLAPSYDDLVFNIAERLMIEAIAKAFVKEKSEVRKLYKEKGDLGETVYSLSSKTASSLTVSQVYESLKAIAQDEGEGSVDRKIKNMAKLLADLDRLSAKYVARIPVGRLRLGFSDKTVLDALSWMKKGDKTAKADLEKAYYTTPDVATLAKIVKTKGLQKASQATPPTVGVPVLPMLAQRLKDPKDMIAKMGKVAVEPKLDGLRILLHIKKTPDGLLVKAFTRNLNETSWMFPELKRVESQITADQVILDCEAVGVDEHTKKMANFQTTMTRRRKHDVAEKSKSISITFWVFDLLAKNGKNFMAKTYLERREALAKIVQSGKVLKLVDYTLTDNPATIGKLNKKYQDQGLEGIIIKKVDSKYIAGRTGWRWVKMKEPPDKYAKLADTIDCIVMGYTRGRGKRASFGIGQFLAGVKDGDKIKTITKVGTGLTDAQFKELKKRLTKLEVPQKPKEYEVHKNLEPDFWVKPALVVELAADEITKSPTHTAGMALRFPRLVRFRGDKSPSQATTISEIKSLFKLQK